MSTRTFKTPSLWALATLGIFPVVQLTGRVGFFVSKMFTSATLTRPPVTQVIDQVSRAVWRCFLPVLAVALPFGMIIGVQGMAILNLFGAQATFSSLLVIVILREVAPVLAGIMLALQAGCGFAGELGTMRAKEELDATDVMGVDAIGFHVLPRVSGAIVAAPLLTAAGSLFGVIGGFLIAVIKGPVSTGAFMGGLFTFMKPVDVWGGPFKGLFFGAIVGVVCCYEGYHAPRSARGVGKATNRAVVTSVMLIVVTNFFLSSVLYGVFLG